MRVRRGCRRPARPARSTRSAIGIWRSDLKLVARLTDNTGESEAEAKSSGRACDPPPGRRAGFGRGLGEHLAFYKPALSACPDGALVAQFPPASEDGGRSNNLWRGCKKLFL